MFRISNWNYVQIRHHVYQCFYVTFYKELLKDWGDFEAMSNQESGVEWKNLWGRGRVVLGQEPILAPNVNFDNIWWQNVKNHIWKYFFTTCTFYNDELINFFYSLKKWELRSSIFQNLFLNVRYPFNFPPKYPISQ